MPNETAKYEEEKKPDHVELNILDGDEDLAEAFGYKVPEGVKGTEGEGEGQEEEGAAAGSSGADHVGAQDQKEAQDKAAHKEAATTESEPKACVRARYTHTHAPFSCAPYYTCAIILPFSACTLALILRGLVLYGLFLHLCACMRTHITCSIPTCSQSLYSRSGIPRFLMLFLIPYRRAERETESSFAHLPRAQHIRTNTQLMRPTTDPSIRPQVTAGKKHAHPLMDQAEAEGIVYPDPEPKEKDAADTHADEDEALVSEEVWRWRHAWLDLSLCLLSP